MFPMKKTIIALAIAAAGTIAVPAAFAQSMPNANHDGAFVKGQVGRTHMDHDRYNGHDTGYQLTGGYRWAVGSSALLGVEGGYNDLGNIKAKNVFHSGDVYNTRRSQLRGWMLGVNGHFNLNPNWFINAHTGVYSWKGHGMSNNETPVLHNSLDKTSWYAGAGFGYDFSNNFSLGLNYDYYRAKKDNVDLSTDMISVGGEYRF
jgi:OOP family OmpA-OmpF porin/outer membrane immunogenic protein